MSPKNAKQTSRGGHAEEELETTAAEAGSSAPAEAAANETRMPPREAEPEEFGEEDREAGETGSRSGAPANAEMDALRDRHLRLAAEFDNYRKRTERERGESWTRAQAQLVERLLEPLDDLQRVIEVDAENTSVAALLEGVQLVQRKLLRVLEGAGLETIQATGQPFDPSLHEALMMVPTENPEEDHQVAEVFKQGYSFKGILLRPALVQVKRYEG